MFLIWARKRGDLTKYYWNRRKNEWVTEPVRGCLYPTHRGSSRRWAEICTTMTQYGFNECGWQRA